MSNWRPGICLQQIFSDFPKRLELIRWTGASSSLPLRGAPTPARLGLAQGFSHGYWPAPCGWGFSSCFPTSAKCADAWLMLDRCVLGLLFHWAGARLLALAIITVNHLAPRPTLGQEVPAGRGFPLMSCLSLGLLGGWPGLGGATPRMWAVWPLGMGELFSKACGL